MSRPFLITPACVDELERAFQLLFAHLPIEEQTIRVANAVQLTMRGELDPQGVLVARTQREIIGTMLCALAPGSIGLVWPPVVPECADRRAVEDALVQQGVSWLRQHGSKLGQALLPTTDISLAAPLERQGFAHVTSLWYLVHDLKELPRRPSSSHLLTYQAYRELSDVVPFHETLLTTYEGTLDCPEINGVRTIEEIMAGHRVQGSFDPAHWWLTWEGEQRVGVLLLAELPDLHAWDVSYIGVVPSSRGRGLGGEIMGKALLEARAARTSRLTLSVDARNRPAWHLYGRLGFVPFDQREVYLAVWR